MWNLKVLTPVVLLLLAVLLYSQSSERYAILPQKEAPHVSHLCSRSAPKVDGGWQATTADTDMLESRLPLVSKLESKAGVVGVRITHPERYYRQYVGIVVKDRKLIYVNAFLPEPPTDWRDHLADFCDGGSTFWGAVYDPKTQQFSELSTNGLG